MVFLSTVMQLFYVWSDNIFTSFAAGGETWTGKLKAGRTLILSFDIREMVSKMWTENTNLCFSARTFKAPATNNNILN